MTRSSRAFARRRQHRADLDRVMGIIVDDQRAVDLADPGEAALDPGEALEAADERRIVHLELEPDRDRGERVEDIVPARHRHEHALDQPPLAVARRAPTTSNRLPPSCGSILSARRSASAEVP